MAVDGTWDRVLASLTNTADAAGTMDWSLSVDSSIARAHQHARTSPASQGGDGAEGNGCTLRRANRRKPFPTRTPSEFIAELSDFGGDASRPA
jgi:hypothetical protein